MVVNDGEVDFTEMQTRFKHPWVVMQVFENYLLSMTIIKQNLMLYFTGENMIYL